MVIMSHQECYIKYVDCCQACLIEEFSGLYSGLHSFAGLDHYDHSLVSGDYRLQCQWTHCDVAELAYMYILVES